MKFLLLLLFSLNAFAVTGPIAVAPRYDAVEGASVFKNYVKNPSCLKNTANITASGGSLTRNNTNGLDAGFNCTIDASASGQTYDWSVNTQDRSLTGRNCEVKFIFQGDASLYVAEYLVDGTQYGSDLTLTNESTSGVSKVVSWNMPCNDHTVGRAVRIKSTSASAAAIQVAQVYYGEATNLSQAAVNPLVGTVTVSSAGSTSISGLNCDVDKTYIVEVKGAWTASDGNSLSMFPNNDTGSNYQGTIYYRGSFGNIGINWTSSAGMPLMRKAGTQQQEVSGQYTFSCQTQSGLTRTIVGSSGYLNSAQPYAGDQDTGGGWTNTADNVTSLNFNFNAVPGTGTFTGTINVYRDAKVTQTAVNSNCIGTANCENTFSAAIGASGGAVSKENVDWINGSCTGTTQKTCTFNSDLFSAAPSCVCSVEVNGSGTLSCRIDTLSSSSIVYTTTNDSVADADRAINLICSRQASDRKPGQNAPVLVGSVTSGAQNAERIERFKYYTTAYGTVCSASPCGITSSLSGATVTRASIGAYTLNFPAGTWSSPPTCNFYISNAAPNSVSANNFGGALPTTTSYFFHSEYIGAGSTDSFGDIICMGSK